MLDASHYEERHSKKYEIAKIRCLYNNELIYKNIPKGWTAHVAGNKQNTNTAYIKKSKNTVMPMEKPRTSDGPNVSLILTI